ncbi:MAG: 4Fe-4S dicluster domain-containing protein [Planctomycetota bacterium]
MCLAACPKGCIFMSEESNKMGYFPANTTNEVCTGCSVCALMCPDACIKVYRDSGKTKTKKSDKEQLKIKSKSGLTEEKV